MVSMYYISLVLGLPNTFQPPGQAPGHGVHIREVCHELKRDKDLMAAKKDPEKMAELKRDLEEHREEQKSKARVSNKSAANRTTKMLNRFAAEVSPFILLDFQSSNHIHIAQFYDTCDATDLVGFCIFTRGSYDSSISPVVLGRGPVADFFQHHFKFGIHEVLCMFESWCTKSHKRKVFLMTVPYSGY